MWLYVLEKRESLQKELLSNILSWNLKSSFVIVTEIHTPSFMAQHFRSWSEGTYDGGKRMEQSLKSDLWLQSFFWWSVWIVFNRERFDFLFFHPLGFSSGGVQGLRPMLKDATLTSFSRWKTRRPSGALWGEGEAKRTGWGVAHPVGLLFPVPRVGSASHKLSMTVCACWCVCRHCKVPLWGHLWLCRT